MKKNKRPPQKDLPKDLGGGKWVMDIQYSHKGKTPTPTFFLGSEADIKMLKSSIPVLYQKISSVEASIRTHKKIVSDLRKQEILLLNSPHNSSDLKPLLEEIQQHKRKINKFQKQLAPLKSEFSHLSSRQASSKCTLRKESSLQHTSVPSPKKTVCLSISIGDYLYHKTYGYGIVYLKCCDYFKVFFSSKSFHSFSYQDSAFENQTLTQLNHWNSLMKSYTTTFAHITNSVSIPSHLQKDYNTFIIEQHHDLPFYISYLFSISTESSLQYYAQRALNSIYNIQHSEEIFLSLKAIEKVSTPPPKVSPVPNQLKSPNSKPSLHEKVVPSTAPTFPTIQYKPASDTLYVYSGRIKCIRNNHMMTCVNALIDTASGETAKLNINCCLTCNRFYISYDEYEHYLEKYKSLLTRIILVNQDGESTFTNNLAAESILKLCGYSVSQEKGLSQKERQALLSKIIHAGIVNKPDVIQHLNWLIKMNGKKAGNDIAKEKWEDDLFFVRNLDMNSQSNYKISSISPYSNKKTKKRY